VIEITIVVVSTPVLFPRTRTFKRPSHYIFHQIFHSCGEYLIFITTKNSAYLVIHHLIILTSIKLITDNDDRLDLLGNKTISKYIKNSTIQ
jgi:hypothetical protein